MLKGTGRTLEEVTERMSIYTGAVSSSVDSALRLVDANSGLIQTILDKAEAEGIEIDQVSELLSYYTDLDESTINRIQNIADLTDEIENLSLSEDNNASTLQYLLARREAEIAALQTQADTERDVADAVNDQIKSIVSQISAISDVEAATIDMMMAKGAATDQIVDMVGQFGNLSAAQTSHVRSVLAAASAVAGLNPQLQASSDIAVKMTQDLMRAIAALNAILGISTSFRFAGGPNFSGRRPNQDGPNDVDPRIIEAQMRKLEAAANDATTALGGVSGAFSGGGGGGGGGGRGGRTSIAEAAEEAAQQTSEFSEAVEDAAEKIMDIEENLADRIEDVRERTADKIESINKREEDSIQRLTDRRIEQIDRIDEREEESLRRLQETVDKRREQYERDLQASRERWAVDQANEYLDILEDVQSEEGVTFDDLIDGMARAKAAAGDSVENIRDTLGDFLEMDDTFLEAQRVQGFVDAMESLARADLSTEDEVAALKELQRQFAEGEEANLDNWGIDIEDANEHALRVNKERLDELLQLEKDTNQAMIDVTTDAEAERQRIIQDTADEIAAIQSDASAARQEAYDQEIKDIQDLTEDASKRMRDVLDDLADDYENAFEIGRSSAGEMIGALETLRDRLDTLPKQIDIVIDTYYNTVGDPPPGMSGGGGGSSRSRTPPPGNNDNTPFYGGGFTGYGNSRERAGIVHRNEVVIPQSARKRGLMGMIAFLMGNDPGLRIPRFPIPSASNDSGFFGPSKTAPITIEIHNLVIPKREDAPYVMSRLADTIMEKLSSAGIK